MRTIKFRGKRLDNKKWIYGYLHECVGSTEFITFDYDGNVARTPVSLNHTWILVPGLPDSVGWDMNDTFIYYEVDRETVGQFTGLCDKDGKEIYEGDILELKDNTNIGEENRVVRNEVTFEDGTFGIIGEITSCLLPFFDYYMTNEVVVGNIYDNPELLKNEVK